MTYPARKPILTSLRVVWSEQKTFRGYEIEMFWALLTTMGSWGLPQESRFHLEEVGATRYPQVA